MSVIKFFVKAVQLIKKNTLINKTAVVQTSNELLHPRFGISKSDPLAQKRVPNSLLFLMYSKENETLFI